MWSIPYEFQCYILVIFLGAAGFLRGATLRYILLVAVLAAAASALPTIERRIVFSG